VKEIRELHLMEISLVDEPANPNCVVISVTYPEESE
jgi:hypothetical protein